MATSATLIDSLTHLARIATHTAGAALLGMAAVEAWQVFARYVLNDSPGWTEPVALLLLNTAMSLGAAVGVRSWSHFGFFVLAERAPLPLRRILRALTSLIVAALGATLAVWASMLLFDGIGISAAGTMLPRSAAYLPMGIGGALMCLFALERLMAPMLAPALPAEA